MSGTEQEQQATEATATDETEATATDTAASTDATEATATDTAAKTSVSDFDKALWFIELGIENLGKEAKPKLVALVKEFL